MTGYGALRLYITLIYRRYRWVHWYVPWILIMELTKFASNCIQGIKGDSRKQKNQTVNQ